MNVNRKPRNLVSLITYTCDNPTLDTTSFWPQKFRTYEHLSSRLRPVSRLYLASVVRLYYKRRCIASDLCVPFSHFFRRD